MRSQSIQTAVAAKVLIISNKKASIRWQDSAPQIWGCLSCNNR